jgi:flagellar motor switch protein FliM
MVYKAGRQSGVWIFNCIEFQKHKNKASNFCQKQSKSILKTPSISLNLSKILEKTEVFRRISNDFTKIIILKKPMKSVLLFAFKANVLYICFFDKVLY